MTCKILLTSFQTWLPHQASNSSDDLLAQVLKEIPRFDKASTSLIGLRQLPVDVERASCLAIAKIEEVQPDAIICCGMAERRTKLTIESRATSQYVLSQRTLTSFAPPSSQSWAEKTIVSSRLGELGEPLSKSRQTYLSRPYLSQEEFLSLKGLQYELPNLFNNDEPSPAIFLKTSVDLETLVADLSVTEISHDAGKFVCEGLYYQVLKYLCDRNLNINCIFVHVPVLNPQNSPRILADFLAIIQKIASRR